MVVPPLGHVVAFFGNGIFCILFFASVVVIRPPSRMKRMTRIRADTGQPKRLGPLFVFSVDAHPTHHPWESPRLREKRPASWREPGRHGPRQVRCCSRASI